MGQQLAYPHTVRDIIDEYTEKMENLDATIREFQGAVSTVNMNCEVGLGRCETLVSRAYINRDEAVRILKASAWRAVYKTLNLDKVLSASDKKRFDQQLSNPPEPTPETLGATFGQYWQNPRYYILQGLAEVFCGLDKFYKSHSNFGFGVKGLPKRAILGQFKGWGSWGHDRLTNMCQAMEQAAPDAWLGEYVPEEERKPWRDIIRDNSHAWKVSPPFKIEQFGIEVRCFLNGNAHVHFNKRALELINDCLHEFYGHVVPDDVPKPDKKQQSMEVSKDLAFYPTPAAAIQYVLSRIDVPKEGRILEPSCGEGAIMLALLKVTSAKILGVEYHPQRVEVCRRKGLMVWQGNFLDYQVTAGFDMVMMNPPFAGQHWVKHIHKAHECLRPGGQGVAILPATAEGHVELPKGGIWYDLPMGSFRESGTNVNTGFYVWGKRNG